MRHAKARVRRVAPAPSAQGLERADPATARHTNYQRCYGMGRGSDRLRLAMTSPPGNEPTTTQPNHQQEIPVTVNHMAGPRHKPNHTRPGATEHRKEPDSLTRCAGSYLPSATPNRDG